jgi:nitrogen fixation NifU-like protein
MSSDFRELYQETILDHNKNPRNYHAMPDATHHLEGFNPLCGDRLHLYLRVEKDIIKDASFEGQGCAISKSSASLMTAAVKGKTIGEAETIFNRFHELITSDIGAEPDVKALGKLAVFAGVREFPARIKCAILPWHTFHAALNDQQDAVSTE